MRDDRLPGIPALDTSVVTHPERLLPFCCMHLEPEDFASRYAQMGEPELMELAGAYDSLTEPAQAALRAEFTARHLDPPLIEDTGEEVAEDNLITLRRYRDLSEAIVARGFLESAGIYVFLCDENLVRLDWQVSNFIGGIRLQVRASDAPEATELLNQSMPAAIPFGGTEDFLQPLCPRCSSADITFEGSSRGAAITSLYLLSLPLPLGRETWLCHSCDARWEDTVDEPLAGT